MDKMRNKRSLQIARCALEKREEAPISGEYVLPEYCPDVAVILKCFAYPRLQNRQWSGDQLLVDGTAVIRVVYLDEQRRRVRTLEFAQPFSCTIRNDGKLNDEAVEISLTCKYLTCRAVSPRRVEVRGAISVEVRSECVTTAEIASLEEKSGLYLRTQDAIVSLPGRIHEKIVTVNESLGFDTSLPSAEMLLGGECCAVIKECKLLSGKAIVKGMIYVHQLYVDSSEEAHTHVLDYAIPFSQILDVSDASDEMICRTSVQVLSDTERCSVGPDGENTTLDVSVKLLLQLQIYKQETSALLYDAYHCRYPLDVKTEEITCSTLLGQRFEDIKYSLQIPISSNSLQEIIDVWVHVLDCHFVFDSNCTSLKGRLQVGVIAYDRDGEIVYHEFTEEFCHDIACQGNHSDARPVVTEVHYRVMGDTLDVLVQMMVCITERNSICSRVITDMQERVEAPYPTSKASTLLYYAEAEESVWDIARACHASPQGIMEENALTTEFIAEKTILVVPIAN